MAQQHTINGTNINYITEAIWQDIPAGEYLNGKAIINRWRRHIWRTNVMPMSEFDTLYALQGQIVAIATTNYEDRNAADYKTYYGVEFKRISGSHEGPNMQTVICEFLVRL
jgi:hypothetical protein